MRAGSLHQRSRLGPIAILIALPAIMVSLSRALPDTPSAPASPRAAELSAVDAFVEEHCLRCHDARREKGGLDLETLEFEADRKALERWAKVHDKLHAGEMPPSEKRRPPESEVEEVLSALSEAITRAERALYDAEGRVPLRRLNRVEYEYTLVYPDAGPEWLGTQGDVWDAQHDMLMALAGAVLALVTLGRSHDRGMRRVRERDG